MLYLSRWFQTTWSTPHNPGGHRLKLLTQSLYHVLEWIDCFCFANKVLKLFQLHRKGLLHHVEWMCVTKTPLSSTLCVFTVISCAVSPGGLWFLDGAMKSSLTSTWTWGMWRRWSFGGTTTLSTPWTPSMEHIGWSCTEPKTGRRKSRQKVLCSVLVLLSNQVLVILMDIF